MASLLSKIGAVGRSPAMSYAEAFKIGGCEGKDAFDSPAKAIEISRRMSKAKGEKIDHYRCRHCGLYHLGSHL